MSFLTSFENIFKKLFGRAPSVEHLVANAVNFAAPFAEASLALYAPEALPIAQPIITEIQSDLATVSVIVGDGTAPEAVATVVKRIVDNFGSLLTAAHIKDDATASKAKATVTLIQAAFNGVLAALPKSA